MQGRREGREERACLFVCFLPIEALGFFYPGQRSTPRSVLGLILGGRFRWMDVLSGDTQHFPTSFY